VTYLSYVTTNCCCHFNKTRKATAVSVLRSYCQVWT